MHEFYEFTNQDVKNSSIRKISVIRGSKKKSLKTLKINTLKMKFKILFLFLLIQQSPFLMAQTTLQVVTKSIEKTLSAPIGTFLNIDAEKADVTLRTDSRSREVRIKIELTARHPQLDIAKHDIEALKTITENSAIKFISETMSLSQKARQNLRRICGRVTPSLCRPTSASH